MIEPLDRYRRDSTLFQFTTKRLRDFLDPDHVLLRIDEGIDFQRLVAPLEEAYCPDNGRPAIHPEVLIRALLLASLYNITSFRRLCGAITENIAFPWFCFLTLDDPVFDHSTISRFIDRIGRGGFAGIFQRFNAELLRAGLLSPRLYVDSSLVQANVGTHGLHTSGKTVDEFRERAVEENELFVLHEATEETPETEGAASDRVRRYQDRQGRLPLLSPVDPDARWRTHSHLRRAVLSYQDNLAVDAHGFIVARTITRSSEAEWKVVPQLLDALPFRPESLAADTGYSAGSLRQELMDRGIAAYIPIHPLQGQSMVGTGAFAYHDDHLVCPEGKPLYRRAFLRKDQIHQYVARQQDCQTCPIKSACLPPRQKRRYMALSIYHPLFVQARERNEGIRYREEMLGHKVYAEGTFASLDRLGWARCRLRGLWKVDCEGFLAATAHNILKLIRLSSVSLSLAGTA